jgi:hypothetical protein
VVDFEMPTNAKDLRDNSSLEQIFHALVFPVRCSLVVAKQAFSQPYKRDCVKIPAERCTRATPAPSYAGNEQRWGGRKSHE